MEEGESKGPSQNRPSSSAGEISDTANSVSTAHIKNSEKETLTGTSHTQNLPSWQSDEEPTSCCISTCGRNKTTHPNIRFFSFPKGAKIRVAWKQACKITYSLKRSTGICDAHFRPHEIGRAGAIPSLNMPSSSSAVTLDKINSASPAHIKRGGALGISKKETLANTTNTENLPPVKSTMKASESRAHPLNLPEPFIGLEKAPVTPSGRAKSAEIAKVSKLTYPLTSKSNSEETTLDRAADAKRRKDDSTPTNPNELHPRTTPDIRIHGLPTDKDLRRACLVTCGILDSNFKFNGSTGVCIVQFLPNNLEIKILCKGGAVTDESPSTNAVENLPPNSKQSALVYRKTEENGNRSAKETLTSTTNTQNLPSLKPTIKESESSAHPLNSEIQIKRKNCGRCGISTCGKSYRKTPNIRIFSFPQDENLRRPWLKACRIEESNYTWRSYVGVCNAHFLPEEIGTRQLRRGAIPSQNLPPTIADKALDVKNTGIKTIADEALDEMNSGIKTIADEALDEMNSGSHAPIKGDCALGLPANETLTSTRNTQNLPSFERPMKESDSRAHPLNLPEPVKIGVSNSEIKIKRKNLGRRCISACGKSKRNTPNIRIFAFPKDENLRRPWLKACGIEESDYTWSSYVGVCNYHFLPEEIGTRQLRRGAIPSQNLPSTNADEALDEKNSGIKTIADEALDEMNSVSPAHIKGDCALGLSANEASTTNTENQPSFEPPLKESESSEHSLNIPKPLIILDDAPPAPSEPAKPVEIFSKRSHRQNSKSKAPKLKLQLKKSKRCAVPSCGRHHVTCPEIRLFKFPLKEARRKLWLDVCGIKEAIYDPKRSFICDAHFQPEQLAQRKPVRTILPSMNLPESNKNQVPAVNEQIRNENSDAHALPQEVYESSLPPRSKILTQYRPPVSKQSALILGERTANQCCISTCGKSSRNTPNIRIFGFPKAEDLRRAWLQACGIEESDFTFSSSIGVCKAHFLPQDTGPRLLRSGAIPSQNLPSTITDEALDEMNSGLPAPIKGDCALGLPANETLTSTTNTQNLPSLKPTIKESESSAHPLNLPEPLNSMDFKINVKIGVSNSETKIKRKNCGRCCISTCGQSYRKTPNIRIFSFPKAENLRRAWLKACGIEQSDFTFSSSIGVCKDHFLPQDTGPRILRSAAIPSQNLPPCQGSQCDQEACNFCLYSHKRGDIYRARYRRTMRNLAKLKNKLDEKKKKMRMVRSQFKFKLNPDLRRPKDCAKMRMILRKANGLSNSAQVMFLMLLKPFQSWNEEEKQLVLSLYYENPFALFDLRSKMNLHLPSRTSIIRWVGLDQNASKPKLLAEKTHRDSEWNIEDIDGDLENPDIDNVWNIEKIDADLEDRGDISVINEKMNGKDIGFEGVECDDIVYEGAESDDTVFEGAGCDDTVYEGPECDDIKVENIEIHDIDVGVYEERVFKCETE